MELPVVYVSRSIWCRRAVTAISDIRVYFHVTMHGHRFPGSPDISSAAVRRIGMKRIFVSSIAQSMACNRLG